VLIFPEGTRTHDGEVGTLKSGFCGVTRRSHAPLVPVGIDGAFQAWPRSAKLPRFGRIAVVIGPRMEPELIASLSDEEVVAELTSRIKQCLAQARALRN